MKKNSYKWFIFMVFICLGLAPCSLAEFYKWVDANGVVHFSDQPHKEDPNDIPIETRPSVKSKPSARKASDPIKAPAIPLPVPSPAAATPPTPAYSDGDVELFVTRRCRYCTMARNYLNAKGIPFTEYDVQKDKAALQRKRRLDPRRGVPLAVINGQTILGFSPAAYEEALAARPE
jgi:glutaredoxin